MSGTDENGTCRSCEVSHRECECGDTHTNDWWDGYDQGRSDGFEEGVEWADEND